MEHQFKTNTPFLNMGAQLCPKAFSSIQKFSLKFPGSTGKSLHNNHAMEKVDFWNTFGIKIDSESPSKKPAAAKIVRECHSGFHQRSKTVLKVCVQPVGSHSNQKQCLRVRVVAWRSDTGEEKGPYRNYIKLVIIPVLSVLLGYLLKPFPV